MTTLDTIREGWIQQAVDYLLKLGVYLPGEAKGARELAETLWESSDNELIFKEGTHLSDPEEAVDEEMTYWGD